MAKSDAKQWAKVKKLSHSRSRNCQMAKRLMGQADNVSTCRDALLLARRALNRAAACGIEPLAKKAHRKFRKYMGRCG